MSQCSLFLAAVFAAAHVCVHAQQVAPEKVHEVVAYGDAFVKAVIDTSTSLRKATIKEVYSPKTLDAYPEEKLLAQLDRLKTSYGAVEYHHSDVVSYSLHMFVWSPLKERWLDFQARIDPDPPHKILQVVFIADVAEPVSLPNGSIESPEVLSWLSDYIDKLVADEDLSGSVLIAQGETPIFERTFGFADPARTREITPETSFSLGSGNKMFTALAIMKLQEEGRLSLDDPISKYFSDFPYPDFARKATIHHLLSHTSGLGDYWTAEYEANWHKISSLEQMLPYVYADSVYFNPGDSYQYSNSGFILLGLIVEKVTGGDYFDYVRRLIYEPLAMTRSDSYLKDDSDTRLAFPLARDGKSWKVAKHGLRGSSAGGGYSTARDLLAYSRGLFAGKIVGAATLKNMTTSKSETGEPDFNYGYGFMLWRSQGKVESIGHAGQAYGINFEMRYYPQFDLTTVVFCNQGNGAYDDLRANIVKLITGDR